jgi:ATP-dependent Lhr-like helicase
LLARETASPPWGRLLSVFRRLEAQGEIRGGRFVAGVAGEQYALPVAVERLRQIKEQPPNGKILILAAADPANLAGVITTEPRVPATHTNSIALRDGRLIAACQAGVTTYWAEFTSSEAHQLDMRLRRIEVAPDAPARDNEPRRRKAL